jgi:tetratricopeptide (TPR) repeat protein
MAIGAAELDRLLVAAKDACPRAQWEEAVATATRVIDHDPKCAGPYQVRAEAYRRLKRFEPALADLAVAIRLAPQAPSPYVIRATILKGRNRFVEAITDLTQALSLDPRLAAAFALRAQCGNAIGDHKGASDDLEEMVRIDPNRPVPMLEDPVSAGDGTSAVATAGARFWKQGGQGADLSTLADGEAVDKGYRSHPAIDDEEAPEALGAASGYKPETSARPIPRTPASRPRRGSRGGGYGPLVVLGVAAGVGLGVFVALKALAPQPAASSPAPLASDRGAPSRVPGRRSPRHHALRSSSSPRRPRTPSRSSIFASTGPMRPTRSYSRTSMAGPRSGIPRCGSSATGL